MKRLIGLSTAVAMTCLAFAGAGHAQGRDSVVVAPIIIDSGIAGRLPAAFSSNVLRKNLEIALESTQLFTVPTRDSAELDGVLNELVLSHRRSARPINADYVIAATVMSVRLGERRQARALMRDKDLISVSGSMSLVVTVLGARTVRRSDAYRST